MPYTPTWNNPYFPQTTAPQSFSYSQGYNPTVTQYQQPTNGIIKVNGRDSALQYQLPPNSTSPALFDNNGQTFYVVTTDGTGAKTVEAFDFSQHVEETVRVNGAQFVSREEFDGFVAKVNAALEVINGVHEPVPATNAVQPAQPANVNAALDATGGHVGAGVQPRAE